MSVLLCAWLGVALIMSGFWLHQVKTLNANLVDVAWAGTTGLLGMVFAWIGEGDPTRRLLLGIMTLVWGGRLAWHILQRSHRHLREDGRYRYLREHWASGTQWKFFAFYQAQGLTVILFALPFWLIASTATPAPDWALVLSSALWLLAVGGEALADRQLDQWRADPTHNGRTCRTGLWRYSRHPNYFFEWLHWWTYVPLAWGSGFVWVPLLVQGVMLLSLFRFTGIPHSERQALASRGEDYRAYQASTSQFIPWFPKHAEDRH